MNCEPEKLYPHYTNKSPSEQGVFERSKQRLRWLRSYQKNGTCKRKLERAGIIGGDE